MTNKLLWIPQTLLALHTATGALWKASHSEQTIPTLSSLPHGLWLLLAGLELLAAFTLLLPARLQQAARRVPLAASVVVAEMLLFAVTHLRAGAGVDAQLTYWLVVATFAGLLAYARRGSTAMAGDARHGLA